MGNEHYFVAVMVHHPNCGWVLRKTRHEGSRVLFAPDSAETPRDSAISLLTSIFGETVQESSLIAGLLEKMEPSGLPCIPGVLMGQDSGLCHVELFPLLLNQDSQGTLCDRLHACVSSSSELCFVSRQDLQRADECGEMDALLQFALEGRHSLVERPFLPPFEVPIGDFQRTLKSRLHKLLTYHGFSKPDVLVHLETPREDDVAFRVRHGLTVYARMRIWRSAATEPLDLRLPWPWQGVFFFGQADPSTAPSQAMVWVPALTTKPGLWYLTRCTPKSSDAGQTLKKAKFRVALTPTIWLDLDDPTHAPKKEPQNAWEGKAKKADKRFKQVGLVYLDGRDQGEDTGTGLLQSIVDTDMITHGKKALTAVMDTLSDPDHLNHVRAHAMHEDDLNTRRLYTYAAFLLDFITRDLHAILTQEKDKSRTKAWDGLVRHATLMDLPISTLSRSGRIRRMEPRNGVHALSQLTLVQRNLHGSDMLPEAYRQNHPSFFGHLCPVESPESKQVGLVLHLARGARVNTLGEFSNPSPTSSERLGWGAAQIPFFQHNDGARNMMGAKNMKQALPVGTPKHSPIITTGVEAQLTQKVHPVHQAAPHLGLETHCGVDLLVAYLPWHGLNHEDAIVANARLQQDGTLDWTEQLTFTQALEPGWTLAPADPADPIWDLFPREVDEQGLLRVGTSLHAGTVLARFHTGAPHALPITANAEGVLERIEYLPPGRDLGGKLAWTVKQTEPLQVGDKLMGRYGNKGVISAFVPEADLPRLPVCEALGPFSGRAPDLILNPHGVISRMNLGQLAETQLALLAALGLMDPAQLGGPFESTDLQAARNAFKTLPGFDEWGRTTLHLPSGKPIQAPVVVGVQHIFRLEHVARRKARVRRGHSAVDRYSCVTGQPASGGPKRTKNRGQRLGEMEVWALAANGLDHNLQETLAARCRHPDDAPNPTYQAVVDHLYALGFSLQDKKLRRWAPKETPKGREITSSERFRAVTYARFQCPICKAPIQDDAVIRATQPYQGEAYELPCLRDIVNAETLPLKEGHLAELIEELDNGSAEKRWNLRWARKDGTTRLAEVTATLTIRSKRRDLKLTVKTRDREYRWRFNRQSQKSGQTPAHEDLWTLYLGCWDHANRKTLDPSGDVSREHEPLPDGLEDPRRFGNARTDTSDPACWGWIRLPQTVTVTLGKGNNESLSFRHVPVLPLRYRAGHRHHGQSDELTAHYVNLIKIANSADKKCDPKKLQERVQSIVETLMDRLHGKYGLVRRDGMGRRVDHSARLVIVPDPSLNVDQCGVPAPVLCTLFASRMRDWMDAGSPSAYDALHLQHEEFWELCLMMTRVLAEPEPPDEVVHRANRIHHTVQAFLNQHPQLRVLLNRAPSLHRHSIQAFIPVATPLDRGMVLRIHPMVCGAFGADFDGDEMSIHAPQSDVGLEEADQLRPSRNLFATATGKPLLSFSQDFVLGHFLLSMDEDGRESLITALRDAGLPEATLARHFESTSDEPSETAFWKKEHGDRLLETLCTEHPNHAPKILQAWMETCFRATTEVGCSFGFLELEDCQPRGPEIQDLCCGSVNWKTVNNELNACTLSILNEKLKHLTSDAAHPPGWGVACLACSGARGGKQVRQLVTARGFLNPSPVDFPWNQKDFFFTDSLFAGMEEEAAFHAAMNSRSSMVAKKLGTPQAGYLTRRLVYLLWPWRLWGDDCGHRAHTRCIATCQQTATEPFTICRSCYEATLKCKNLGLPLRDGLAIGLLAAQSMGERGTQLSMQAFHTGEKAISLNDVIGILEGKKPSKNGNENSKPERHDLLQPGKHGDFLNEIRSIDAYKAIDPAHVMLLWRGLAERPMASGDKPHGSTLRPPVALEEHALAWLCYSPSRRTLKDWLQESEAMLGFGDSPYERVLMGQWLLKTR